MAFAELRLTWGKEKLNTASRKAYARDPAVCMGPRDYKRLTYVTGICIEEGTLSQKRWVLYKHENGADQQLLILGWVFCWVGLFVCLITNNSVLKEDCSTAVPN